MVKIYNKRHGDAPADAVYVGRPTKHGNKYTHLKGKTLAGEVVGSLEESIQRYFKDLIPIFANSEKWHAFTDSLVGKDLVCWCAPKGGLDPKLTDAICHAQVLAYLISVGNDYEAFDTVAIEDEINTQNMAQEEETFPEAFINDEGDLEVLANAVDMTTAEVVIFDPAADTVTFNVQFEVDGTMHAVPFTQIAQIEWDTPAAPDAEWGL